MSQEHGPHPSQIITPSRRRAIQMFGLLGAALATADCRLIDQRSNRNPTNPVIGSTPSPAAEVISAKQQALEDKFKVLFLTPQRNEKLKLVDFITVDPTPGKPKLVQAWDDTRLGVFEQVLPQLPATFYAGKVDRNGDNYPLVFALMQSTETSRPFAIGGESRTNSPTYPIVVLLSDTFQGRAVTIAENRSTIVHELSHNILKKYPDAYQRFFVNATGMRTIEDLDRVYASIEDPSHRQRNPDFKSMSAYGAYNQEEHTAIAGEHYFEGEEAFMTGLDPNKVPAELRRLATYGYLGYVRFLGAEQALKFYNTLKGEMFDNREFRYQKLLTP